jgi:hypothetical protein
VLCRTGTDSERLNIKKFLMASHHQRLLSSLRKKKGIK